MMASLQPIRGRFRRREGTAARALSPGAGQAVGADGLREQRDALAAEMAELQYDLGGLTYEMAIRDHFRLDVLVQKAARLQRADAALARAEHLLRVDEAGAAGACTSCGALFARGARYCAGCGTLLDSHDPALGDHPMPALRSETP